eukprot:symbB.v1.2.010581.t1/scaffold695.1/size172077/9
MKTHLAHLPATHQSSKEVATALAGFVKGMSQLITNRRRSTQISIRDAFDTRAVEITRLAYLEPTVVPHLPELISVYSRLHMLHLSDLHFSSSLSTSTVSSPRVGFVSGLFGASAVGNLARGIIWPLHRKRLWVALISLGPLKKGSTGNEGTTTSKAATTVMQALLDRADHVEELTWASASPGSVTEVKMARQKIQDLDLKFLIFLEIGLDVRSFVLAHSRLCPFQLATYGHASTTGIATVDFFLSVEAFESHENAGLYSEQLITLPGLPYFLPTTSLDATTSSSWERWKMMLEDAGIERKTCTLHSHSMRVYLVAQSLYKVVPSFDRALLGILSRDKGAVVAIRYGHPQPHIHKRIARRIMDQVDSIKAASPRLCFIPMQNASSYFWMLRHAEVVLDTFPHSGHTTTLDSLSVATPLVFLQQKHLAGGFASGFYHAMEEAELLRCCMATDVEEYVKKAVHLASHGKYRKKISKLLQRLSTSHVFERRDWSKSLEEFLMKLNEEDSSSWTSDVFPEYSERPDVYTWSMLPMLLTPRKVFDLRDHPLEAETVLLHTSLWPLHEVNMPTFQVIETSMALAGHGASLTPVFCCAPLSFSEVVEVMPQMGFAEKQSTGEMWHLGLAHHEVTSSLTTSVLYLLSGQLRLRAISIEFCFAEKPQAGVFVFRGHGSNACGDAPPRWVKMEMQTEMEGEPSLQFALHDIGVTLPAKILGAMMHPVVTVELGPMMLSDGLR